MVSNSVSTARGFALKFIVYFAILSAAFEASRGSAFEHFVVVDLIISPTTKLIELCTPQDNARLQDRVISSPAAKLRVTRGCEGIEMFLLLVAGIVAFPVSWPHRLRGLGFGSVLAYALSVARLMTLYYILRDSPSAWEALHGLVLPLGPIIAIALYFMHWTAQVALAPAAPTARAA
jgi:exosortase/archaeosortase family protein